LTTIITITSRIDESNNIISYSGTTDDETFSKLLTIDAYLAEIFCGYELPGVLAAKLLTEAVSQAFAQYERERAKLNQKPPAEPDAAEVRTPMNAAGYLYKCAKCNDWGTVKRIQDGTCMFCNGAMFYLPIEAADMLATEDVLQDRYAAFLAPSEGA
jgi:hypothetical protein